MWFLCKYFFSQIFFYTETQCCWFTTRLIFRSGDTQRIKQDLNLTRIQQILVFKSPWLHTTDLSKDHSTERNVTMRYWSDGEGLKWCEIIFHIPADRHVCHSTLLHLITISTEGWTNQYNQNQYSQLKIFKLIWLGLQTVTWHCAVQFIMLKCLK